MSAYALTIGGKPSPGSGTFDVLNPADGSVVAACPQGSVALVDAAVESARGALAAWAGLADAERVAKLMAVADLIDQHHAELSELITREQGKTQSGPGANLEVDGAAAWTRVTARLSLPEETIQDDAKRRSSCGASRSGWSGRSRPGTGRMMIAAWHVMPALRVGCTVVIKPSPFTPLSTLRLVELMNQVLPPGVINVGHRRCRGRSLTGESPGHQQDRVHRFDRHRQEGHGRRRADAQARDARARRQRCRHRPARHQHRAAAGEAVLGLLHQCRPDLRRTQAPVRARRPVRGGGAEVRRLRDEDPGGRRVGPEEPHRAGLQQDAAGQGDGATSTTRAPGRTHRHRRQRAPKGRATSIR